MGDGLEGLSWMRLTGSRPPEGPCCRPELARRERWWRGFSVGDLTDPAVPGRLAQHDPDDLGVLKSSRVRMTCWSEFTTSSLVAPGWRLPQGCRSVSGPQAA